MGFSFLDVSLGVYNGANLGGSLNSLKMSGNVLICVVDLIFILRGRDIRDRNCILWGLLGDY